MAVQPAYVDKLLDFVKSSQVPCELFVGDVAVLRTVSFVGTDRGTDGSGMGRLDARGFENPWGCSVSHCGVRVGERIAASDGGGVEGCDIEEGVVGARQLCWQRRSVSGVGGDSECDRTSREVVVPEGENCDERRSDRDSEAKVGFVADDSLGGLTGAARRKKKRALKRKEVVNQADGGDVGDVSSAVEVEEKKKKSGAQQRKDRVVSQVDSSDGVPEWRVKSPRAPQQFGAFRDCSEQVQRQLRETRARRLVAENEVAEAKARAEIRKFAALEKADVVAREVAARRYKADKAVEQAYASKFAVPGYAQTVLSEGLTDVVFSEGQSSGSVSPNSSISVEAVARMEHALGKQIEMNRKLMLALEEKSTGKVETFSRGGYDAYDEMEIPEEVEEAYSDAVFSESEYFRRLANGGRKTPGYKLKPGGRVY